MDRDLILENVNRLTVNQIVSAINEGIVTFEELQNTGKFLRDKQDAVKDRIDDIEKRRNAEKNAWEEATNQNTIESYKEYLEIFPESDNSDEATKRIKDLEEEEKNREEKEIWKAVCQEDNILVYQGYLIKFPEGLYINIAQRRIEEIKEENRQKRVEIFDTIKKGHIGRSSIEEYLTEAVITEEDLIKEGFITEKALEVYLNPPRYSPDIFDWEDLDPLKPNRTDIYFLGIPGSGKSTLLGGLLYYTYRKALLRFGEGNNKGYKYAEFLRGLTKLGYMPPPTMQDAGVNYIEADFLDVDEDVFPVNILEMSGEKLVNTINDNDSRGTGIGERNYLENDNKKVLFFIIDYKQSIDSETKADILDQNAVLDKVLTILNRDGVLQKTNAIYTILTKCDQLPGGAEDLDSAKEYLNEEYLPLKRNLQRYGKIYKFKTETLPFSIGRVMLKEVFEFVPLYSENLYKEVISSIQTQPRKKRFGGLF